MQSLGLADASPKTRVPSAGVAAAELCSVTKSYGATVAIADVSLELRAGEVLALIGENGAGKSTCVNVLAGVTRPDAGELLVEGAPVSFHSALDSHRAGIAVVHQHAGLFPDLSIAENVCAGQVPRGRLGLVDHSEMAARARAQLEVLGLDRNPLTPVGALRTSERQLVEIARALAADARVLILDEPTAALSTHEVERLFAVVDRLRERGVAMLFVGHRLEEIFRIADRVTVLRDGRVVTTAPAAELTPQRAVELMVGRDLGRLLYPERSTKRGAVVLGAHGLTRAGDYSNVDLEVRAGEIVGLAGLVGSGRTEVARTLFGITRPDAGELSLDGEAVRLRSAADALRHGIAYISEDRRGQSLVMDFGILANATLPTIERATRHGLVSRRAQVGLVDQLLQGMRLRYRTYDQPARTLSGGNQQKVALAKWLATKPRVLILDEPTQGIDVQAKVEVHRIVADLAAAGLAIILISSDLPEILGMSDRVVVMREGTTVAELPRAEVSERAVAMAAMGAADAEAEVAAPAEAHRPASEPPAAGLLRRLAARRELGLLVATLLFAVPIIAINPRFVSGANLTAIATDAALLAIVAAGQMLVMLTRSIDLSVGSVIGLSAYISADTISAHPGLPVIAAVLVAVGVGVVCGAINGAVVTYGGVPAIVVTLGTLSVYRGLDSMIAGSRQISADQVPEAWLALTSAHVLGVPLVILLALGTLAITAALLRFTAAGRELYAIGSNPEAAEVVGIRVRRRILLAFVLCGALAGFAGALWASRYATVDARSAQDVLLTVIASVVVGGVAIFGGSGTVLGIALGTLTLLVIQNGLGLVRVDPLWLQAVYGAVILAAVAVDRFLGDRSVRPA